MDKFYPYDDWSQFTSGKKEGVLDIAGVKVPFVTMNNEPESKDPDILDERYSNALGALWDLYSQTMKK
jgi:hypothetical protein